MKALRILGMATLVATLTVASSCGTGRQLGRHSAGASTETTTTKPGNQPNQTTAQAPVDMAAEGSTGTTVDRASFMKSIGDNAQTGRFLTSKVKFTVEKGNRKMTLTGNLHMKRNDCIRLQLMAFGFVEAGRLEFTPEYVLIIDRINKLYLKVPYAQLDFLRNNAIDFYVMQALFWNELFQPGQQNNDVQNLGKLATNMGEDNNVVISMERDKLSYRWLADRETARVKMANIMFRDHYRGNYQLNWDYDDFKRHDRKYFPTTHKVGFSTPTAEVKFDMMLNYLGAEDNWETRTELSGKYRQVEVDEILRRFMSL